MLPAAKFSFLSYHTIIVVQLTTPFIHTVAMAHPDKIAKGIQPATLDKGTTVLKLHKERKQMGVLRNRNSCGVTSRILTSTDKESQGKQVCLHLVAEDQPAAAKLWLI